MTGADPKCPKVPLCPAGHRALAQLPSLGLCSIPAAPAAICHILGQLCALEKDGNGPFQPVPRLCSVRDEGELTRISAPGIPAQHPGHPQLPRLGIPAVPGWIFHPSSLPWRSARPPLVTRAFLTAGKGLWLRVRVCKAAPASSSSTAGSERVSHLQFAARAKPDCSLGVRFLEAGAGPGEQLGWGISSAGQASE